MTFLRWFQPVAANIAALALLVAAPPAALAVKPAAPSGVTVDSTLASDSDSSGASTSYRLVWQDNADNEDGYAIKLRGGTTGNFGTVGGYTANTEEGVVTLKTLAKDTKLQFLVMSYKYNGANVEYNYLPPVTVTVTEGTGTMVTPTGLAATNVGDGTVKLTWTDASTNEMYHQIMYKKAAEANFTHLGYVYFNTTEISLQLGLVPGESYQFAIRATRQAPGDGVFAADSTHATALTAPVSVTIPSLAAPTELEATAASETSVRLEWKDNSTNESYYEVEYRADSSGTFASLGTVAASSTTTTIPVQPNSDSEWQVRAVYSTSDITTPIQSAPSNVATISTTFSAPSELQARTSAHEGTVELTWRDNSTAESKFDIYTRRANSGDAFTHALAVPAGTIKALIKSRGEGAAAVPLEQNVAHEFRVQARYVIGSDDHESGVTETNDIVSDFSATKTADAKPGITSRFYQPATVGSSFSYQLQSSSGRTAWSITGLPAGLTFSTATGGVTGTPTVAGVFECPMAVTFDNGWVAQDHLTLRVMHAKTAPIIVNPIPAVTIAPNTPITVSLADKFGDRESEKAVRFSTTLGDFTMLLYPSLTPNAVENFMGYVNSRSYDGVCIHRSIPGFVIQGGGFTPIATPKTFRSVTPRASPENEPGISNVRGTIASAKVANNPDSATHDFFLNLANNNDPNEPESLDNQNGGFTAFGRVTGTGMNVVDAIAALPTGDYIDKNTTSDYDESLDKRVIVDNSPASFQDFPMDVSGAAPADMDVTKAVIIESVREISPLTYELTTNSAPAFVHAAINGNQLTLKGIKAGTSDITVTLRDLDNNTVSQTFTVTVTPGYRPPAVTRHPASVAVAPGGKASFTVGASGTALQYQWRHDGANMAGANSATLKIDSVDAADLGSYDVVITNAAGSSTSRTARLDYKAVAAITSDPMSQIVEVGDPLQLEVTVEGAPVPVISWTRDNKKVTGQTGPALSIAEAKVTDGGVYKVSVSNSLGKDSSAEAKVCVVDKSDKLITVKSGAKIVLAAGASGPWESYQWYKDGAEVLDEPGKFSGASTANLTIFNAVPEPDPDAEPDPTPEIPDTGEYQCLLTAPDALGVEDTGVRRLVVVVKPEIDDYEADAGVVGYDYEFTIPYDDTIPNNVAAEYFISGPLPVGLSYDKLTGRIHGRPKVAGTYKLTTLLRNAAGLSDPAQGTLTILPMARAGVGSFVAAVEASTLNNNMGGRLDLTVLDLGTCTGVLTMGKEVYRFSSIMTYFPNAIAPQSTVSIPRKGTTPLQLTFGMNVNTADVTGYVTDGTTDSDVTGFRQYWHKDWTPSLFFEGNYALGLHLQDGEVGNSALPQGSGYAIMNVTRAGYAYLTAILADGTTAVTSACMISATGSFFTHKMLYKDTGSILGLFSLGRINLGTTLDRKVIRVSGNMRWYKAEQTLATERTYKAGFGPFNLDVLGCSSYILTPAQAMGVPLVTGNAKLDFSGGGVEQSSINPDVTFSITNSTTATFPPAGPNNPGKVHMTIASSGVFGGTFELADPSAPKRSVVFRGLVVPKIPKTPAVAATSTTAAVAEIPAVDSSGSGFFLLPQLPSTTPPVTTIKTSPILSGKVEFKPISIRITTQPVSREVNPGTNVTFTVVAEGQGTLTYQWRKAGTNISGATGTSYTVTNVTESAQASYDVVVSNGATTATSDAATLSVRDAVSNVTVSRSPSATTVATGSSVTFSASATGSGPLTYQWIKDGADIAGATSATYVIDSASAAEHAGNYGVRIKNDITPTGVTNATNVSLAVADGVSNVVISRAPSSTEVQAGETVVFSVTASGEAPFGYQWRKNGLNITGATSATHTITNVQLSDNGSYDVLVTNVASASGVTGTAVDLTVATASTVTVSRNPSGEYVAAGQTVTFTATTPAGTDGWTYQWRRNGSEISGATGATYQITAALDDDNIAWDVVATNASYPSGLTSNGAALRVLTPVSNIIVNQSPSGSVPNGSSVTFTITSVSGGGSFTYQWRRAGTPITDATGPTYTIPGVSESDEGNYDVVVSNAASSATSDTFTLVIDP